MASALERRRVPESGHHRTSNVALSFRLFGRAAPGWKARTSYWPGGSARVNRTTPDTYPSKYCHSPYCSAGAPAFAIATQSRCAPDIPLDRTSIDSAVRKTAFTGCSVGGSVENWRNAPAGAGSAPGPGGASAGESGDVTVAARRVLTRRGRFCSLSADQVRRTSPAPHAALREHPSGHRTGQPVSSTDGQFLVRNNTYGSSSLSSPPFDQRVWARERVADPTRQAGRVREGHVRRHRNGQPAIATRP